MLQHEASEGDTETTLLPWRLAVVGLLVFLVALAAVDARATYGARISVDEPQYLITAISLGEDFDLDVSDELEEKRFLPFHERRSLNQQTIDLTEDGQRLSPHDPLLPAILAIPMRLGGWVAARITMAAIASLTSMLTLYAAVRRFDIPAPRATWIVAALFASPPLISFGNQIYPAMPSATCVVVALLVATGNVRKWWWLGCIAVVALPWLSVKYAPHAAVLALGMLWPVRRDRRVVATIVGVLGAAGVIYLLFHQRVYGGWTVYASGDHFVEGGGEWEVVGSRFNPWGRTRRLVGLIVDQNFGLAAWAPVYLGLPAALTWYATRRRAHWPLLIGLFLVGYFMATWIALTMHGWWWPGRQLMPVMPVAVLVIAAAVAHSRRWTAAVLGASALAIIGWLWLVVEASTDRLTLIVDFWDTQWPFYRAWRNIFPDHHGFSLDEPILTSFWGAVLIGTCALVVMRRGSPDASSDLAEVEADEAAEAVEAVEAESVGESGLTKESTA
ncbi:MAG: hypothetical protein AAF567_14275 [Actinomycetota bacterium]